MRDKTPAQVVPAVLLYMLLATALHAAGGSLEGLRKLERGCGTRALVSFAELCDRTLGEDELATVVEALGSGEASLLDVAEHARSLGLDVVGARMSFSSLVGLRAPAIAHLAIGGAGHFETVERATPRVVRVGDLDGLNILPTQSFLPHYTGHVLTLRRALESARTQGPRLALDVYFHDFGLISAGMPHEFSLRLANEGADALCIEALEWAHDCCLDWEGPVSLAPGESVECTLTFRPETGDLPVTEPVVRHIGLLSNDPLRPRSYITLDAEVMPPLEPYPLSLYMGRVSAEQATSSSRTLRVMCAPGEDLARVTASAPELATRVVSLERGEDTGNRQYEITVQFAERPEPGPFEESLLLHAKQAKTPAVVPVRGEILPTVRLSRPRLFFGFVGPSERSTLDVELSSDPPRPFQVTGIVAPPFLDAQVVRVSEQRHTYRLAVSLDPTGLTGIVQGEITVHTDLPGAKELRMPYYLNAVTE